MTLEVDGLLSARRSSPGERPGPLILALASAAVFLSCSQMLGFRWLLLTAGGTRLSQPRYSCSG